MDSIDQLLAQLKTEDQEPAKPEQLKQQKLPTKSCQQPLSNQAALAILLSELEPESKYLNQQLQVKQEAALDHLLSGVKADYKAQSWAKEQLRQEQLKAEELKLKQQAIAWLKELDSLSTEGLWFEKFAEKYSSKLEAALDYLQEIKENNLKSG